MLELLYDMLKTPSVSGSEVDVQKLIIEKMKGISDEVITHHNINVINVLNKEAKTKILLCGHIDEVGLYIVRVNDDGTCKVQAAGGARAYMYAGQHVRVINKNGVVNGVFGYVSDMEKLTIKDLTLDLGTKSKEETLKIVSIGDPVVHLIDYCKLANNHLSGRALDDKLGAYIILETLKRVKGKTNHGIYASTTVGEETTGRGAKIASSVVNPSICIAVDVAYASDISYINGLTHDIKLGSGPILSIGSLMNPKIHEMMLESAKRLNLNTQIEVSPSYSRTDADSVYDKHLGIPTYLISIPLRYMHSSVEVCDLKDVEDIINLLVDFIINFDDTIDLNPLN